MSARDSAAQLHGAGLASGESAWFVNRHGAPARLHPHMLRRSFASHLLQSSGDLRAKKK